MNVFTFQLLGGSEFRLTVPNNPTLDHNGKRTVWKFVGEVKQAYALSTTFSSFGADVTHYTETENAEMLAEREALMTPASDGPSNQLPDPQSD